MSLQTPTSPPAHGPLDGWSSGPPALADVVGALDADVLHVVRAPSPHAPAVSDVVILDRTDERSIERGSLVLGVGLSGAEGDAVGLIDAAARSAAAAVVFRTDRALPERLLTIADSLDVAVLVVPPEMAWGQLYTLLRTALVSAGRGDPGPGARGVPMGDLFALADAIAASVGGPVTIEDPHWRVLAYSNLDFPIDDVRRQTILGRIPPVEWQRRLDDAGVTRALRSGQSVVRFEGGGADGFAPRLGAPVRVGDEVLGVIWVAEAGAPFGAQAERELSRAADVAAIHLICHRASDHVTRRARGAFVREVLEGRVPASSAGGELPLRAEPPLTVLAFEVAGGAATAGVAPDRILSIVSLYCEDAHRDAMAAFLDERFWVLLPTPRARVRERTVELAEKVVARVERGLHVPLAAGIGSTVRRVADVPKSKRGADLALQVRARGRAASPVVHIDDVRAQAVLLELADIAAQQPTLLQGRVDDLLAHDRRHGTDYERTLRAYLDCWGDVAATAERLGVHANTMRYRVRRLAELFDLDLADADERFVTEFQLRVRPVAAAE